MISDMYWAGERRRYLYDLHEGRFPSKLEKTVYLNIARNNTLQSRFMIVLENFNFNGHLKTLSKIMLPNQKYIGPIILFCYGFLICDML